MKKQFIKTIGSSLVVAFFLFLAFGSDESSSKKVIDCSNSKESYSNGYSAGKLNKMMGGYTSCQSFVNDYNYNIGRDVLNASDCYCEGFNDGQDGNPSKY